MPCAVCDCHSRRDRVKLLDPAQDKHPLVKETPGGGGGSDRTNTEHEGARALVALGYQHNVLVPARGKTLVSFIL